MDDIIIRNIEEKDSDLLKDFLYIAVCKEGEEKPKRSIINNPEYKKYYEWFGKKENDCGLVAEHKGKIIGAVWARKINGIDIRTFRDSIFAISVFKDYRRNNVGTKLMYKMLLLLLEHDYKYISLTLKKDDPSLDFFSKLQFSFKFDDYNPRDDMIVSLNVYSFFRNQVRIYSLEANRYKMLVNEPYQYNDDEVSFFILFLLNKKEIKESLVRFDRYDGYISSNETLQNTENNHIREELLRRKVEKAREIIEKAERYHNGDLSSYNYENLLETRQTIINNIIREKTKGDKLCDGGSGKKVFSDKKKETIDKDEKYEEIIAKAMGNISYENVVYNLIENYKRLYGLTDNDVKKGSGISRKVLNKIKKDQTKPSKDTMLQLCIGLNLNLDQGILFLKAGGYVFCETEMKDCIICSCLERRDVEYISEVNDILTMCGYDEDELFIDHRDFDPRKKGKK